ncbi:SDR family NAD(P)-dependent oxidoreductase [Cohnella algarum]|uniref:SDR family NAD(P)-dependent oxidoreductase n=1 Tax=Cohnella algarum TaxID=2044859 RepID=UPI001967FA7C|nr:SDR family oxidoreductase [Cohnella algarum]MBN2979810.1 SDR family oxidoreductase [Cohnella algarum]
MANTNGLAIHRLVGGTALVTGAARGSGRAIAEAFVAMGADVLAIDLLDMEPIPGAVSLKLDITDEAAVERAVTDGLNGRPFQIVVNNAGIYKQSPFEEHSTDLLNKIMSVNVTAPFVIMRAAANALIDRKLPGAFINLSSIGGTHAHRNCAGYCASKAAVLGLTRATALDLAPHDITVNSICPGTVETDMIAQVAQDLTVELDTDIDGAWKYLYGKIPLGRFQKPEDVASMAVFLASMGARNVTGAQLTLDGGETAV